MSPHFFVPIDPRPDGYVSRRLIPAGTIVAHCGGVAVLETTFDKRWEHEPRINMTARHIDGLVIYDPTPSVYESCLDKASVTGNVQLFGNYLVASRTIAPGESLSFFLAGAVPSSPPSNDKGDEEGEE